ncbi:hypothetical protein F4802DRAFT_610471 [Xylaria palmicola]|nr:hypothetical protein F4802DRAFT_610471 [Xylaria palmicola]
MVPTWVSGRMLCQRNKCNQCVDAPEFIPIHYDCYQIFRGNVSPDESEALDLLWTIGSWRNPWSRAQPIHLDHAIDRVGLEKISKISGLSDLCRLPQELVHIIRDFSPRELFWWSIFISKIERLDERPVYDGLNMKELAYVIEHREDVSNIYVEFKGDFLRLCLSKDQPSLCIWNTCSPPSLSSCRFFDPAALRSRISSRLYARDLSRACGITFFFASGQLFGIYVHLTENSCAMDTYERMSIHRRRRIVWVYMPMAPPDKLVCLGSRKTNSGFSILVQMSLAGEVILGCSENKHEEHVLLGSGTPMTLIYEEPQELQSISIFGTYPSPGSDIPSFAVQRFESGTAGTYFSWASLSHIQSANIFYDRDTGLCRGIIFHYENGGSRAVGQCRLKVDESMMVIQPCVLYFQSTSYSTSAGRLQRHGVRVEITGDATHQHSNNGWQCVPFGSGALTFSFTEDSSYISLI